MKAIILIVTFIYLMTITASNAYSSSETQGIKVSAIVNTKCLVKAGALDFGSYDPENENSTSSLSIVGKVELKCVRKTNAVIKIDPGMNQQNSHGTTRAMKNSNADTYLAYELYQDQGGKQVWNNQNPVTYSSESTAPVNLNIYASIPANQQVTDGVYNDIVQLSVSY